MFIPPCQRNDIFIRILALLSLIAPPLTACFDSRQPPSSASCIGAPNTPGGLDPWGGCWPGPNNTGVPAGTKLVNVDSGTMNPPNPALPSDNTGWLYSTTEKFIRVRSPNAVIDGVYDAAGVYIQAGASLTVKNSTTGHINNRGNAMTVKDSTINGGNQWTFPTVGASPNITVENSNLYGGEHQVLCSVNCVVTNSYLHDNADGAAAGAHQNGFLSLGGSQYTLTHNAVNCVGGCTSDIAFLGHDVLSNAIMNRNLLLASHAAYCVYPGPNVKKTPYPVNNFLWENNVFQRGGNGKCGTYGPVYGWFPSQDTGNVWRGNTWDDGAALNPP
jgi:hypothetical protein